CYMSIKPSDINEPGISQAIPEIKPVETKKKTLSSLVSSKLAKTFESVGKSFSTNMPRFTSKTKLENSSPEKSVLAKYESRAQKMRKPLQSQHITAFQTAISNE